MSIANEVRLYLKNKPYILEALESGIVNLSKLARVVQKESGIKNFHAVKASLRRYSEKIHKSRKMREEQVSEILNGSIIKVLDGVTVIISNRELHLENKAKVKLDSYYVYLMEKSIVRKTFDKYRHNIVKRHENCTTIIISSEENIERVPGVVAFLTSLLAEQNVNVIEFISCYTETIIVIDKADSLTAYEIFSKLIG